MSDSFSFDGTRADGSLRGRFIHDFSRFQAVCEIDRHALEALGAALAGSDRPLLVTSGTALVAPGRVATEDDVPAPDSPNPRIASETAAFSMGAQDVRIVRLAVVHGDGDPHFVPTLIKVAREKGVSAYVGDGRNRWPFVHRLDAVHLYRLALEKGAAGARYHAVADEGVAFRDVAQAIGRHLNLPVVSISPEEAAGHFASHAHFAQMDGLSSSKLTQERLGWRPVQPSFLTDLERGSYFKEMAQKGQAG